MSIKVLLVTYHWNQAGGLEKYTVQLGQSLARLGALVDVWAAKDSTSSSYGGIVSRPLAPSNRLLLSAYARLAWQRQLTTRIAHWSSRYDLVIAGHVHMLGPIRKGLQQINGPQPPCWVWAHGSDVWGNQGERLAQDLDRADAVVSVSRYTASHVANWVAPQRLHLLPPAIDTNTFVPCDDFAAVVDTRMLIVGRLDARDGYKGHDVLIEALPTASSKCGKRVSLSIVGDGEDRNRLEALVRDRGLEDCVQFWGGVNLPELVDQYQHCGAFVMPSRVVRHDRIRWTGEGFGIVYLEAAACGRPVIASTDGGAREAIVAGETGLLVDPRSVDAVADAIATLVGASDSADAMGRAGRVWVEENFSIARFDERLGALLAQL